MIVSIVVDSLNNADVVPAAAESVTVQVWDSAFDEGKLL